LRIEAKESRRTLKMKIDNTGWKKEMDALMKSTQKNWNNPRLVMKASGISASLNLGKAVRV
jgi:hypothetical protein